MDLARVTRNRRNTQVLRAEQKQLTPRAAVQKSSPLDPSRGDPKKLVVPAQQPDADACARDGARIPTIAYQRAG